MDRGYVWRLIGSEWVVPVGIVLVAWISSLLGAALAFVFQSDGPHSFRRFVAFCFPRKVFGHQLRLDVAFALARRFLYPFVVAPVVIGVATLAYFCHQALAAIFGAVPAHDPGLWQQLFCFFVFVAYQDFGNFYYHRLAHRVPWLWEFHAVHHSATMLTPPTNRRFHPLQDIYDSFVYQIPPGLFIGIFSYAAQVSLLRTTVLGIDAWFLVNMLSFYQLRHSHIYLRYPRWLERWIMSPAQHQIHHSKNPEHVDRNFGVLTSIWDRLWGTLVYSDTTDPDHFELGLASEQHRYVTFVQLYATPLVNYGRRAKEFFQDGFARCFPRADRPAVSDESWGGKGGD